MVLESVLVSFSYSRPVFPAPLVKEIVFSPLYILASFVKDKVSISESEVTQSCPTLCDPWTVAHQAPSSMGFSRQEYWSELPFPSPILNLIFIVLSKYYNGIKPVSVTNNAFPAPPCDVSI